MVMPSQDVVNAIEAGITRVTRRVELYEADGVTPFYPNGSVEDQFRLIGGNVSVDSTRDERRAIDITLDNKDGKLKPNANGGLWYDKIIKPYRGVRFPMSQTKPKILIIESPTQLTATILRSAFAAMGFTDVTIDLTVTTLSQLSGYTIIVSDVAGNTPTAKATLLQAAFNAGYKIFTKGPYNGVNELPWVIAETATTNAAGFFITPYNKDTPITGGWSSEQEGSISSMAHTTISPKAITVAYSVNNSITHPTATIYEVGAGRWFDYKPITYGTQAKALMARALYWLWNYQPYVEWETPLGVFMIDNFKTSNFPHTVPLSGRDFTKKALLAKIRKAMDFDSGTKIVDFITALGANAGITKFRFDPTMTTTIGSSFSATRGDPRWSLMSKAANIADNNLYFDLDGTLTMSPYPDPTLGSPLASFRTGAEGGNLASYEKSANDSFIYNMIVVTGTPSSDTSDVVSLGFYGEASNTRESSPTRISRIGERTMFYESPFFTSDAQCVNYANSLLKIHANEQYDLNLSGIVYPWIEAGIVVDFKDPEDSEGLDPVRFVGQSFGVPLDLTPMTASAKRLVIIAGS